MQIYKFIYEGMASHALGCGAVLFTLRGEAGPFGVKLTVEDAKHLLDDLQRQVRTASGEDA